MIYFLAFLGCTFLVIILFCVLFLLKAYLINKRKSIVVGSIRMCPNCGKWVESIFDCSCK